LELKGTRHLILSWVPIVIVATVLGGLIGIMINFIVEQAGLRVLYFDVISGSLGGVLALIFVLKKHHIPVRGLRE
jgi:hypothetical protein